MLNRKTQNYNSIRQLADRIIPVTVILTKVRIYRFLVITQIPDQVRNDGTAVVILTKVSF